MRRKKTALVAVVTVGALAGVVALYLFLAGMTRGESPNPAPSPNTPFLISFAGDTLLGDAATKRVRANGWGYVVDTIRPAIRGDYVLVNLEVPITPLKRHEVPSSSRKWTYNMSWAAANELASLGIHGVGLANNHALDRGERGLRDTVAATELLGLDLVGAGRNRAEAEAPLLIDTHHGLVAVLAFTYEKKESQEAGPDSPGVVFATRASVTRGMELAKAAGAEHVVAFVHFPGNYAKSPISYQRRWAGEYAQAGYDLVVGHGAHVTHPVGRIDDTVILYSLGNFVFNTPGRHKANGTRGESLVATAFLGPSGFERVELTCIQADNQRTKYQPRICDEEERDWLLPRLGGLVHREGDLGIVTW